MQNTMGEAPDDPPDARWVSYAELGHLRGIGRESAIRLARREKWPRQPGNDGSTRVLVPPEWLKPSRDNPPERADRRSPEGPGEFGRAIRAFEHAAAALAARAEQAEAGRQAAEARAEAERGRADQAETDRRTADARADSERARADRSDQALTGERAKADALRDRLEASEATAQQARGQAQAAEDAAEQLRKAEAARKARGLLARLRAAVRRE